MADGGYMLDEDFTESQKEVEKYNYFQTLLSIGYAKDAAITETCSTFGITMDVLNGIINENSK